MKEAKCWQNCIELSLDSRQIFLIFFSSAVVISLVFSLGVIVGKRLDKGMVKSAPTDPLALLDQMGQENIDADLTFQEALTGDNKAKPKLASASESEIDLAPSKKQEHPPKETSTINEAKSGEKKLILTSITVPSNKLNAQLASTTISKVKRKGAISEVGEANANDKNQKKVASKGTTTVKQHKAEKVEKATEGKVGDVYSLQLSSFQEKSEAEIFMKKLREAGLKPYVIPTNIPGRGVWYRVRLGKYKSWEEALTAKQDFEKKQRAIAYVSKN